jgi:CHAT domain-containing protein/tetratricopeptide (TPR) repeat protein
MSAQNSNSFRINLVRAFIASLSLVLCQSISATQDGLVTSLETDKPVVRELSGGESHSYQLTLAAGQYARVAVEQRGINVGLALSDESKLITEMDLFPIGDVELVSMTADHPTTFRIDVKSPRPTAPKGSYEIKIKFLRAATELDRSNVAGESLMSEAVVLLVKQGAESWRKSIEKFEQAAGQFKTGKQPAWEATADYLIAQAYIALRDKQKSFQFAQLALPIADDAMLKTDPEEKRLGVRVKSVALNVLAQCEYEFGDRKKAVALLTESLGLVRGIDDQVKQVDALTLLSYTYELMGDYRESLDASLQAQPLLQKIGDPSKVATSMNNLCVLRGKLGEYKAAIDSCNQAISIWRGMSNEADEAVVLNNLGVAYSNSGEYQNALDAYTKSYTIHKSLGRTPSEAIALNNIAWVYGTLGDRQKAIDVYTQALEMFRAQKDPYREANTLSNIAVIYTNLKNYSKALELNLQVLPIRRSTSDREGEATTLNSIALCYSNLGEKQKAEEFFNQSLELSRTRSPRQMALTLRNLGSFYREQSDYSKALQYLNVALEMTSAIGDQNGKAATLSQLALLERDRGNLLKAKEHMDAALATVESLRINVKSQKLRASYFSTVRNYHEINIDLLMRLHQLHPSEGFDVAAVEASERGRARSLLELLAEAKAEIRRGVDQTVLERERVLRNLIATEADQQTILLSGTHTDEQIASVNKKIDALIAEHDQVEAQVRQMSPRYASLVQPVPLGVKEIQSRLLSDDTVLLEYSLGEKKSFVWAVTPNSIKSFELPKRADIEAASRRVYELLVATNRNGNETEFASAATSLSKILLEPVAAELKNKRLLIVGEGVLQYVPFSALPEPRDPSSTPLVVNHEIVNLPSASVLWELRNDAPNRPVPDRTVAVFADPVFDVKDPRLTFAHANAAAASGLTQRNILKASASEPASNAFARLRFTRQEADQIVRLAPEQQSSELVDFAANRARATSDHLGRYRIVHFATHGLVNNQQADLSGIVLSLVDEKGQPQDGFLRLYDIYNMNLNADLVVLSACQTALGEDIKGEGLVGLTRAFMYAGAKRVVASLWQTEDRATAELMVYFYQAMLKQNMSPAAALRRAQVSMLQGKRWQNPRYWASFTIQGEWK